MLHRAAFVLLIFAYLLFGTTPCQAQTTLFPDFHSVLDMDRTVVKDKSEAPVPGQDRVHEFFEVGNEHYRLAAYAPEFLFALRYAIRFPGSPVSHVDVFSGGSHERNEGALRAIRLIQGVSAAELVSDVLSFDDLTLAKKLPPGVDRAKALEYFHSLGGQDRVPFFEIFKKDLRLIGSKAGKPADLNRLVIFDDNADITPADQIRNVLVVARPDVNDEELIRPDLGRTPRHEEGDRNPIQIARSKYRLVRAIGLLRLAIARVEQGESKNLPDALSFLQWDENGRFRADVVNQHFVYQTGMEILERVYQEHMEKHLPHIERGSGDFKIRRLVPRPEDCARWLDPGPAPAQGVLPWERIEG